MAAGILAFFQALPALMTLISRLGLLMDSIVQHAQQNNFNGWMDSLEKQIDDLKNAKSSEEKLAAAQALVGTFRGLGPS